MPTGDDERRGWSIDPPIPESARTVLVYGGAFDPPHTGHIEPALAARDAVGADWALFIPAASAPLRDAGPTASGADRLEMLRRALAGRRRTSVSDVELARGGTSYTIDTLRALRDRLPETTRMRLLIGADQAAQFHRWREPGAVMTLAEPIVVLRGAGDSAEALLDRLARTWPADEVERWRARLAPAPIIDASSTVVRAALARGDSAAAARLVDPAVLDFIRARNLYREGGR